MRLTTSPSSISKISFACSGSPKVVHLDLHPILAELGSMKKDFSSRRQLIPPQRITGLRNSLHADDRNASYSQVIVDHTNFTHIFPPSTSRDLESEQPGHSKAHYAGTVWDTVLKYGDINVLDELNGLHMHRLYNGLTLITTARNEFDRLLLWFEAIPNTQHTYRVCTLIPSCGSVQSLPHHRIVTFSTTTDLPLPDSRYLKLHAVVCRVGHLSGVAAYLDAYDREQNERNFLARDGSSAEYLTSCLHSILGA